MVVLVEEPFVGSRSKLSDLLRILHKNTLAIE